MDDGALRKKLDRIEQRIDDFRSYVDGRFERVDQRLDEHTHNHHGPRSRRSVLARSGGIATVAAGVVYFLIELVRRLVS